MIWEMHEAAKKIADGWHSELEYTRKRNAVLGRENANLRKTAMMLASARTNLLAENANLRDLVLGMMICSDDSEEAQKCPLYDENEPYRCRKDRLMSELGF